MLTFLRPHSLDFAQDADATLASGGVHEPRSLDHAKDADGTLTWGGVGWGCFRSFDHVASTLHKMLVLRSHGVGWGGDVYVPSTKFPRPCTRC